MRFDVITLFPKFFETYFAQGVLTVGIEKGLLEIYTHNLRDYGLNKYKQVDDRPFGGGAGMVLMFEPMAKVIDEIKAEYARLGITKYEVVATTAGGKLYKQSVAKSLSENEALILLCGRYEGFDQRILDVLVTQEISMGNFVLTGGEIPVIAVIDSIARTVPGVLNSQESYEHDSFYSDDETVQYPQYTRPEKLEYNGESLTVPPTLLSGNHAEIEKWRDSLKARPARRDQAKN